MNRRKGGRHEEFTPRTQPTLISPPDHTMHHLILILSCLVQMIEAYTYEPAKTVTLTEGQTATFICPIYLEIWSSGQIRAYYAEYNKYLCRDPCGPHDWNSIIAATNKALAPNRDSRFTIAKVPNSNGAQITISDAKSTDTGTYWCGIEYPNSDMYRQLKLIVNGPPDSHDTSLNMLSNVKTAPLTSRNKNSHLDGLNIDNPEDNTVQQTLRQCNDNSACALAVLHKKELKIPGDCWVCHALAARWQAKPLTAHVALQSHVKESWNTDRNKCTIPLGMMMLLIAGQQIRNNAPVVPHPNISCVDSHSAPSNMAFEVPLQHAETCVCSTSSSGPYLGQSSCQTRIFVNTTTSANCSHRGTDNTLTRFACPFRQLSSQPGIMWSCGKTAYHDLPSLFQWSGCCHPSIVTTDTKVFHKKAPATDTQQHH
ncbi:uncharacterized protein LOC117247984 [Xyrichtys novacula]|uniref:Uncharacterized protein LOC117247984 n=1 Tax=Xyrichtys novacula TaxID=13765 RepID=A0AAV1G740_XYRNO|nr:uncharacterized protein LOC117247984 [Xyrichtys novacula]